MLLWCFDIVLLAGTVKTINQCCSDMDWKPGLICWREEASRSSSDPELIFPLLVDPSILRAGVSYGGWLVGEACVGKQRESKHRPLDSHFHHRKPIRLCPPTTRSWPKSRSLSSKFMYVCGYVMFHTLSRLAGISWNNSVPWCLQWLIVSPNGFALKLFLARAPWVAGKSGCGSRLYDVSPTSFFFLCDS